MISRQRLTLLTCLAICTSPGCQDDELHPSNRIEFLKLFGGQNGQEAAGIVYNHSSTGYVLLGSSQSNSLGGHSDFCLVFTDPEGNLTPLVGDRYIDRNITQDYARDFISTDEGYVLVGSTLERESPATASLDTWVVITDTKGDTLRTVNLDPESGEADQWDQVALAVDIIADGFVLAGSSRNVAERKNSTGNSPSPQDTTDFWVARIDKMGNSQWRNRTEVGLNGKDRLVDLIIYRNRIFALGQTFNHMVDSSSQIVILEFDPFSGNLIGQETYPRNKATEIYTPASFVMKEGTFLIAGTDGDGQLILLHAPLDGEIEPLFVDSTEKFGISQLDPVRIRLTEEAFILAGSTSLTEDGNMTDLQIAEARSNGEGYFWSEEHTYTFGGELIDRAVDVIVEEESYIIACTIGFRPKNMIGLMKIHRTR